MSNFVRYLKKQEQTFCNTSSDQNIIAARWPNSQGVAVHAVVDGAVSLQALELELPLTFLALNG